MSSFSNKKTSFIMLELKNNINLDKLKELSKFPTRDITDEPIMGDVFFSKLTNENDNEIEVMDNRIVAFTVISDKKKIPKNKISKKIEELKFEYIKMSGVEPEEEMNDEFHMEAIKVLSVGQHPQRIYCGVIIDLREKMIYIEKKGWLTDFAAIKLNQVCGVEIANWSPFEKPFITSGKEKIPAKTLFLQWLYLSMENAKIEMTNNSQLTLSNSIKFFDEDNKITVKGKIIKFIDVYRKLMSGAKVEECTIKMATEGRANFEYTLKLSDSYIHGFCIKGNSYRYSDDFTLSVTRSEEFLAFRNHMKSLVKMFEKGMES